MYFARHGYVFVLVDTRGRGSSGGTFDPFAQEARDGYDLVEWLGRQSWSNGKVAMRQDRRTLGRPPVPENSANSNTMF